MLDVVSTENIQILLVPTLGMGGRVLERLLMHVYLGNVSKTPLGGAS